MEKEFTLTSDYIELIRLLKYMGVCETGGDAKMLVDAGMVKVNGLTEFRRRAKLRTGDVVGTENILIRIM